MGLIAIGFSTLLVFATVWVVRKNCPAPVQAGIGAANQVEAGWIPMFGPDAVGRLGNAERWRWVDGALSGFSHNVGGMGSEEVFTNVQAKVEILFKPHEIMKESRVLISRGIVNGKWGD